VLPRPHTRLIAAQVFLSHPKTFANIPKKIMAPKNTHQEARMGIRYSGASSILLIFSKVIAGRGIQIISLLIFRKPSAGKPGIYLVAKPAARQISSKKGLCNISAKVGR
jgi:hypothetical protein